MIADFLDTWELLHATWLSGVWIAFTLGLTGLWVVARDQLLLGAAVSQASTLGVAVALAVGAAVGGASHETEHALHFLESDAALSAMAVLAAVATAGVAIGREHGRGVSGEAVTGWIFLLSASLPVLLVAKQPHGLETVQRLVFSTLLSASDADLARFAGLALATAVLVWSFHDRLMLLAMDPETAGAVGMRRNLWYVGIAVWLGVAVGLAIRTSGAVFTFGCLVLPGLAVRPLFRETRPILVAAPLLAAATALVGFVVSHARDWPPAHTVVALLCGAVVLAWTTRVSSAR